MQSNYLYYLYFTLLCTAKYNCDIPGNYTSNMYPDNARAGIVSRTNKVHLSTRYLWESYFVWRCTALGGQNNIAQIMLPPVIRKQSKPIPCGCSDSRKISGQSWQWRNKRSTWFSKSNRIPLLPGNIPSVQSESLSKATGVLSTKPSNTRYGVRFVIFIRVNFRSGETGAERSVRGDLKCRE